MFKIFFKAAKTQPVNGNFEFTAKNTLYTGESWCLTGTCRPTEDEAILSMNWVIRYSESTDDQYFSGTLDRRAGKITGSAGLEEDTDEHTDKVFLSQQPPEVLVNRPHPTVLAEKKYSALWRYALDAVLLQVRRNMWSWSYFRDRRNNLKRHMELSVRRYHYGTPLSDEETIEYFRIKRTMYPADARYLNSELMRLGSERIHQYVHLLSADN